MGTETKHTFDLSDRFFMLLAVLIIAVAVFFIGTMWYRFSNLPQNVPQQISVSADGRSFAKPDIAQVSFGMNTQGQKTQDVVDKNNEVMNAVITSVKSLGVEDKDIQTTMYSLNPQYDYTQMGRVFKGYSLDQQIMVKIRNFDKISDILDAAVAKGANTVSDLQFTIDDPIKAQAEARAQAIERAKEKAQTLVAGTGLKIDKIINISEGYASTPTPMYDRAIGGATAEIKNFAPEVQTGQMEINSTVTLTYLLK